MEPITLNHTAEILNFLNDIALKGKGFKTDSLLDQALDAGFTAPDYLTAYGEDPDASYKGKSPAWAVYHVRQWKRVFMVYGGEGRERRVQLTETP